MSTPALNINELVRGFFFNSSQPEKDPKYQIIAKIGQEMIERSVASTPSKEALREKLGKCYSFLLPDSEAKDSGQFALDLYQDGVTSQTMQTFLSFRLKPEQVGEIVPDANLSPSVKPKGFSLKNALAAIENDELY